jgi:chromosome segregation ATPase
LGRAKSIAEYVRKGYDKASVEIVVSGGPGLEQSDYRIERDITKDGKSTFKINGAPQRLPCDTHSQLVSVMHINVAKQLCLTAL